MTNASLVLSVVEGLGVVDFRYLLHWLQGESVKDAQNQHLA